MPLAEPAVALLPAPAVAHQVGRGHVEVALGVVDGHPAGQQPGEGLGRDVVGGVAVADQGGAPAGQRAVVLVPEDAGGLVAGQGGGGCPGGTRCHRHTGHLVPARRMTRFSCARADLEAKDAEAPRPVHLGGQGSMEPDPRGPVTPLHLSRVGADGYSRGTKRDMTARRDGCRYRCHIVEHPCGGADGGRRRDRGRSPPLAGAVRRVPGARRRLHHAVRRPGRPGLRPGRGRRRGRLRADRLAGGVPVHPRPPPDRLPRAHLDHPAVRRLRQRRSRPTSATR